MNYIKQLNAFYDWVLLNPITPKQQALYLAILNMNNKSGWTKEFTIANQTLQAVCPMAKSELHKVRGDLKRMKLIEYQKGKKGQAGTYSIIPLYETNVETNPRTNTETNVETNPRTNDRDITKHKLNENETTTTDGDVFKFYENNFGVLSPFVSDDVGHWIDNFSAGLVIEAMKRALQNGKPWNYARSILKNWRNQNITTLEDVEASENAYRRKKADKQAPSLDEEYKSNSVDSVHMFNMQLVGDD